MGWFRRDESLNEKLMREAGLTSSAETVEPPEPFEPHPRHQGPRILGGPEAFNHAGVTGIARLPEWDVTTTAEAPGLEGDEVGFDVLPDGTVLVEEEAGDEALAPLADAVERSLSPPYRARGVRRGETQWAVAAKKIEVAALPDDVRGDEIELAMSGGERTLTIDGARSFGSIAELERLAGSRYEDYVVHATRLDGNAWEVKVAAL